MDDIDFKIISVFQNEGLLSSSVVGRMLNIAESTVRRRIRQLTRQNIIRLGYYVNPVKLGLQVSVFIALDVALDKLDDVAGCLAKQIEVRYVALVAGHHNVVALAMFRDSRDLSEFLKLTLGAMPGIRGCEVMVNIGVRKAGPFS